MAARKNARAVPSDRIVNIMRLATLLGRDRNTVMKWIQSPDFPVVQRGSKDSGLEWQLDIAEVVKWRERRVAEETAEKFGADDGVISEAEGRRRRVVAQAIAAEAEAAEILGTLAPWSSIVDRVNADYAEIRTRLSGLGEAIAGRVPQEVAARVKEVADEQVIGALKSLRADDDLKADTEEDEAA